MLLSWTSITSLLSIAIIVFIVTLLLGKNNRSLPNNLLALFLTTLMLILINEIFISSNLYLNYPSTIFLPLRFLGYLLPVLLYLYAKYLLLNISKIHSSDYLHFIPFFLISLYFSHYSFLSSSEKITYYKNTIQFKGVDYQIAKYIGDIIKFTYLFLTLGVLRKSKKILTENFSNSEISKIDLLKKIIMLWVVILILYQIVIFGFRTGYFEIPLISSILSTINLINIFILGVWGIANPEIIPAESFKKNQLTDKYTSSNMSVDAKKETAKKLINLLENHNLYRNPNLTIQEVAEELKTSKHNLSEVINSEFQKSFFDLINEFRIKDFISKMENPKNDSFTLLSLAFESGFNSKSSFYRIFKNFTGKTPAQYKNEVKSN